MSESLVRVGMVGIGTMGAAHARLFVNQEIPGARLAAVSDVNPTAMEEFTQAEQFPSGEAMIASGELDAVVVATPHYDHPGLAIAALEAGLHLVVEKPLAVSTLEAGRIIKAYEKRPRSEQVFAVMFNQRTNPRFVKLREMIRSGELGSIQRVSWIITDWFRTEAYFRSGGWRATWAGEGGGVLVNQCPHQLDLMQWLFGLPKKVRAFAQFGADHEIEVEDRVTAYLEYADRATGTFIAATGEFPGSNRLEVACDRGKVVIDESRESDKAFRFLRTKVEVSEHSRVTDRRFDGPEVEEIVVPIDGKGGQHKAILVNFIEAIRDGADLIGPGVEGMGGVELANAMLYSAWTDRTVELPVPELAYAEALAERAAVSRFRKKPVVAVKDDVSGSY
ncbi:MAG: Gfo/Idh/MocA family oxidoreductase [Phycisphaeraceae bacterium]